MMYLPFVTAIWAVMVSFSSAVGPTDEYRDADLSQSSYLTNHNMDPAVVDSSQFGQLWKVPFHNQEQVCLGKPTRVTGD